MRQRVRKGRYLSYLLRLWETRDGENCVWYATLEPPIGDERHSFASLDELFAYLACVTAADGTSEAEEEPEAT